MPWTALGSSRLVTLSYILSLAFRALNILILTAGFFSVFDSVYFSQLLNTSPAVWWYAMENTYSLFWLPLILRALPFHYMYSFIYVTTQTFMLFPEDLIVCQVCWDLSLEIAIENPVSSALEIFDVNWKKSNLRSRC